MSIGISLTSSHSHAVSDRLARVRAALRDD